jgi:tetratricopeptide (TPR) repeat protein
LDVVIGDNIEEGNIEENNIEESTESNDNEIINAAIEEAMAFAANDDYENALEKIKTTLVTYPQSEELLAKEIEYTDALTAQAMQQALEEADSLTLSGDYISAIDILNNAQDTYGEDSELSEKVQEYEDIYVSDVIYNADELVEISEFEAAENMIEEAINIFPDNQDLKDENNIIYNRKPKNLLDVCMPYQKSGFATPTSFKMLGKDYANGFVFKGAAANNFYAIFNLEGKYSSLEFDLGHIDGESMNEGVYNIYLDGQYSETISLGAESLVTHFVINLNNSSQMKIEIANSKYAAYGFANAVLY